jgi:hypothetical protein
VTNVKKNDTEELNFELEREMEGEHRVYLNYSLNYKNK